MKTRIAQFLVRSGKQLLLFAGKYKIWYAVRLVSLEQIRAQKSCGMATEGRYLPFSKLLL